MKLLIKILAVFVVFYLPQVTVAADTVAVDRKEAGVSEVLPPEVKALIGMRIPSEKQGEFGRIQGWKRKGSIILNIFPKQRQTMGVDELYRDDMSIFAIVLTDETGWSMTVLDVRVLPRHLLNYNVKNGEIVWKKSARAYRFENTCYLPKETVVAIARPEKGKEDCTHTTRQIKRAWKIDRETDRISEIPTQGVSCSFTDSEYSCEPL